MNLIATLEQEEISRLNPTIPAFAPGDTVIVNVKVVEGTRKRLQAYEGVVIAKRNRGLNSSFINAMAKDVPMVETYKGVIGFCVSDVIRLVLLVAFPALVIWLPGVR